MIATRTDGPPLEEFGLGLRAPVSLQSISLVLADVRRQSRFRPRTRFVLDCSAADDLSPQVLADFARLRGELRHEGSDFVLSGCGAKLRTRLNNPHYAALLADGVGPWAAHPGHAASRPHLLGTGGR